MVNPLDYVPQHVKTKLIDAGLTKLAAAAESSGSTQLAAALRTLRSDTPFLEDVSSGLGRALEKFAREWSVSDPELTRIIVKESWIQRSSTFLSNLAGLLVHPTSSACREFNDMEGELKRVVAGRVSQERVRAGLNFLVSKVREELFTHPKLMPVHALFLQRSSLEGQVAILEELRAIRRENAAAVAVLIEGAGKPHAAPLGLEVGKPPARTTNNNGSIATGPEKRSTNVPPPDVLTPAIDGSRLVQSLYEPLVGREVADWLADVQVRVIYTIENADFESQQRIAEELLTVDADVPHLKASANYLLGEAKRLQADFVDDVQQRRRALNGAFEAYSTALDLDGGSPRALRGLARIHEVQGDFGEAMSLYRQARAAALHAYTESAERTHNEHAHEVLRATRHYVSCISEVIRENRQSSWARESGRTQLHGLALESTDLHRTILPRFRADRDWMRIEWFMGLVLLAKGYAAVGDMYRAWLSLLHALMARVEMMDATSANLSRVERGNLLWWCKIASIVNVPAFEFGRIVEDIHRDVDLNNKPAVLASIEEALLPLRPPWGH